MKVKLHLMFMIALFGSSSVYDLVGYYAETLPSQTAYFLGATLGGAVVGTVWLISLKGQQHDN